MSQQQVDLPYWAPPLFFVGFVALWLLVGGALTQLGGWPTLARYYRAKGPRPPGQRLREQVVGMGVVSEHGITRLIPTLAGLYIYSHLLFRFRRPPLLIPWDQIHHLGARHWGWSSAQLLDLGGKTTMVVKDRGFEVLVPYLSLPNDPTSGLGQPRAARNS